MARQTEAEKALFGPEQKDSDKPVETKEDDKAKDSDKPVETTLPSDQIEPKDSEKDLEEEKPKLFLMRCVKASQLRMGESIVTYEMGDEEYIAEDVELPENCWVKVKEVN